MRLKELEIQGFKSFPDRTKITIGPGITGVVGPNGSGKSNISDAIRWVMGETSSKQLRGAGKMEDVIFGGTQTRGAMGFASVSLTIDNSDHGLAMDADEVTIGRRYYRSGESEYTINGQNVRLKDVYELLLDTGLGRDGYAIVGQGRIAEIVAAKSNERREIFEEASGIARFRYRKNEAERRLAAAEGNLERLRDILGELEGRVGPLKRDSEKAQKFLEYSATRKSLEITLWVDSIRRAQEAVRDQQRRYEAAESDYGRLSKQLDEFDARTEALRAEAQKLMLDVEQANADIRALTEAGAGRPSRPAPAKAQKGLKPKRPSTKPRSKRCVKPLPKRTSSLPACAGGSTRLNSRRCKAASGRMCSTPAGCAQRRDRPPAGGCDRLQGAGRQPGIFPFGQPDPARRAAHPGRRGRRSGRKARRRARRGRRSAAKGRGKRDPLRQYQKRARPQA